MMRKVRAITTVRVAVALTVLIACAAPPAAADVTPPTLLSDHMVMQRGLPVHVWGMAAAHEAVSVTFRNETKSATADDDGRWSVFLAPGEAGGPFSLVVKATNTT